MKRNYQKSRSRFTACLVGGLTIGLVVVQLCLTLRCASAGEELDRLEDRALILEEELTLVNQEVSELGSLGSIQARAMESGFIKTNQVVYLPPKTPVALGF